MSVVLQMVKLVMQFRREMLRTFGRGVEALVTVCTWWIAGGESLLSAVWSGAVAACSGERVGYGVGALARWMKH